MGPGPVVGPGPNGGWSAGEVVTVDPGMGYPPSLRALASRPDAGAKVIRAGAPGPATGATFTTGRIGPAGWCRPWWRCSGGWACGRATAAPSTP